LSNPQRVYRLLDEGTLCADKHLGDGSVPQSSPPTAPNSPTLTEAPPVSADGATRRAPAARNRSILALVILAVVVVVHVAFVTAVNRDRRALDHDEIVSQLAASGHQDNWPENGRKPAGTWVTSSQIRDFLEIDGQSSFAETSQNLAQHDVHPPMFFWALYGARWAGLDLRWSGPALNLFAVILASVLLFFLLAEILKDRLLAALAVAIFAFSPALIRATGYTRQYPFLMLASVLLIWVTRRLVEKPRSVPTLVAFIAVGAFGLLTEVVFGFAIFGAFLVVSARWFRDRRVVVRMLVASVASAGLALALFPGYPNQLSRANDVASGNPAGFATRAHTWLRGLYNYVTLESGRYPTLDVIVYIALGAALLTLPWWYRRVWNSIRTQPVAAAAFGIGGVALLGETAAYLLRKSPAWAVGWQYVILFWPAIVLVFAALVRNLSRARLAVLFVVVAGLVGASTWHWQQQRDRTYRGQRRATDAISTATVVVSNCLPRGYSEGAAMWAPPNSRFLLVPKRGPIPPLPADADPSNAFLLTGAMCKPTTNADRLAETLGFTRGRRVGPIGFIYLYRLEPIAH
jgi:hypothetical protein